MAVAAAEALQTPPPQERYAHSYATLRAMGALVVAQEAALEEAPATQQSFANYLSGVQEMMRTDPEFCGQLDVDGKPKWRRIINGQACDVDGTPIIDLVRTGLRESEALADTDRAYENQAIRDGGDVMTAEMGDALRPGQSGFAVSMAPKKALQEHPEIYKDCFGYREDLVYIQSFSRQEDGLYTGFCSIEVKDEKILTEVLAEEGIIIPPDTPHDEWIQHSWQADLTPEQAERHILDIRNKYYERIVMTEERHSVNDYVEHNAEVVEGLFYTYYPGLAKATHSGENNETIQGLANALLQTDLHKMKPEIRAQLIRVANSGAFDDEMCKTMESVIRYAVVEELRKGLKDLITGEQSGENVPPIAVSAEPIVMGFNGNPAVYLNQRMADNVQSGLTAGRSYGGCAGQVELNDGQEGNSPGNQAGGQSKQEPYGGKSCKSIKHGESTTCPHCKKQVKTIVPVAGGKVYCSNGECKQAAPGNLLRRFVPLNKKPREDRQKVAL